MSINVTVNGNPVKIKRGTMVTADPDGAKKELDRRRKIRLTQVRQQSSEIAAKVRKRVQKERDSLLSEIEKKGAEKLERWKMRKLLELQEQYCDSLKGFGLGHAQATIEEAREEVIQASKDILNEKMKQRGQQANKQLREELQKKANDKSAERKKLIRSTEDTQKSIKSINVIKSPFKRKKKRKKVRRKSSSQNKSCTDSDFTATECDLSDLECYSSDVESSNNNFRDQQKEVPKSTEVLTFSSHREEQPVVLTVQDKSVGPSIPVSSNSKLSTPRSPSPPKLADIIIHHPLDTRISDRIKNRRLPPRRDHTLDDAFRRDNELTLEKEPIKLVVSADTLTDEGKICGCCWQCNCKKRTPDDARDKLINTDNKGTNNVGTAVDADLHQLQIQTLPCICCNCKCTPQLPTKELRKSGDNNNKQSVSSGVKKARYHSEIPSKPTVILKGVQKSKLPESEKVQYYDHKNRFVKQYHATDEHVQKIPESDIEILPATNGNEKELLEQMQCRDKEAEVRGKKALEKRKIQKDYKELMEKLPALQRQERIASISSNTSNPAFHMSDGRLKQQEQKKQCKMEDAYEKLFPHTITIKPKVQNINNKPFSVIDTTDGSTLPPFRWDLDNADKDGVRVTKDDGVITINPNVSDQTDNLKQMLDKLKKQKEMLLREVETLPRDSNLNSIISSLEEFQKNTHLDTPTTSPVKSYDCSELLDHLTKFQGHEHKHRKKSPKQAHSKTTTPMGENNKHRKRCHRVHRVILQNTSTQTSPNVKLAASDQSKETVMPEKEKVHTQKQTKLGPVKITCTSTQSVPAGKSSSCSKLICCKKTETTDDKVYHKCCTSCEENGVCEIVIKIQDDVPEINIKSPSKPTVHKSAEGSIPKDPVQYKGIKKIDYTPPEPSSSTSYYSPPDFKKYPNDVSTQSLNDKRKELLLAYMKKLLTMSRKSVENLGVSESTADLAFKIVDLSFDSIQKHFSKTTSPSSTIRTDYNDVRSIDYDASTSNNNKNVLEEEAVLTQDVCDNRLTAVAAKYQSMVDQCQNRISSLAAMIQQVRKEKDQMLSPSFSDKETSTTYLNLPSTLGEERHKSPQTVLDITDSESEREQQMLNKLLLDVNVNLEKIKAQYESGSDYSNHKSPPLFDPEIYERYKKLLDVNEYKPSNSNTSHEDAVSTTEINLTKVEVSHIPVLNVPSFLQVFDPQFQASIADHKAKKPPPAKGLSAAKKFNGEITNVPHELSTILEVDSQLSAKVPSPQKHSLQFRNLNDSTPMIAIPEARQEKAISEESMPDIVAEIKDSESSSNTSDSLDHKEPQTDRSGSSDMDNLEAMLVNMGMGWAVATLRKTQEALVKAASSTSSDDRQKQKDTSNSSTSDITLRDVLGKKLFSTSSTVSASESMSPFIRELEEISAIQGLAVCSGHTQQRTSTPVNLSTEKCKKKDCRSFQTSTRTDCSKMDCTKIADDAMDTLPVVESPEKKS